jgi:hypothetical protein
VGGEAEGKDARDFAEEERLGKFRQEGCEEGTQDRRVGVAILCSCGFSFPSLLVDEILHLAFSGWKANRFSERRTTPLVSLMYRLIARMIAALIRFLT